MSVLSRVRGPRDWDWSGFPYATWMLVVATAAVFGYVCTIGGWGYALGFGQPGDALLDFYERYGVVPLFVGHRSGEGWYGLLTGLFVHVGPWHLALNMVFLRVFGGAVERNGGRLMLVTVFVFAGVFGGLCHSAVYPGSGLALVGASGSVAGVMGFVLAWRGPGALVGIGGLERPALWYGLAWVGAEVLGMVLAAAGGDWEQLAVVPHWTGLGAGLGLGALWCLLGRKVNHLSARAER